MDNKQAKISLIIPAYNEERYIGQCLESVIKNGVLDISEIIVVDNGSTDRTVDIVKTFSNVHLVHERRKGNTRARNRGLVEAKEDIIAYIDADSKMPSGWCKAVLQEFAKNEKLVCLSGPYIYYDMPKVQRIFVALYWYFAMILYWFIGYMAIAGNLAVRKDAFLKIGGFDTNIEFYGDDTDIARRLSKLGKVKFMHNFVMYTSARRFVGDGILSTATTYALNFFAIIFTKKPATSEYKDFR